MAGCPYIISIVFSLASVGCQAALLVNEPEVALAGVSFAGQAATIPDRFPHVVLIDGFSVVHPGSPVYQSALAPELRQRLKKSPPKHFTLIPIFTDLKGRNSAIAVTLMFNDESVVQTAYDVEGSTVHKVFESVDADVVFFDLVHSLVVRDEPVQVSRITLLDHAPSRKEVQQGFANIIKGADNKPNVLDRFVSAINSETYPVGTERYFEVKTASIESQPAHLLGLDTPQNLNDGEQDLARSFADATASGAHLDFLPYKNEKDYTVGSVLPLTVDDGNFYNLKLPEPDYVFTLDLQKLKRFVYGSNAAGASYLYGSKVYIELKQPLSGDVYLDSAFKNVAIVKVPATQTQQSGIHKYAFRDSIMLLFERLAAVTADGGDRDWLKASAYAKDIQDQIDKTQGLFKTCANN